MKEVANASVLSASNRRCLSPELLGNNDLHRIGVGNSDGHTSSFKNEGRVVAIPAMIRGLLGLGLAVLATGDPH